MRVISKDLLEVESGVIAHQVNCKGVMGAGVARQICRKWSKVFDLYREFLEVYNHPLGRCQIVEVSDGLHVANIFGQDGYGTDRIYTDYGAVYSAFSELRQKMSSNKLGNVVHIPYLMGCGLGGGDWKNYVQAAEFGIEPNRLVACKM